MVEYTSYIVCFFFFFMTFSVIISRNRCRFWHCRWFREFQCDFVGASQAHHLSGMSFCQVNPQTAGNVWVCTHHCSYRLLGAKAPVHQYWPSWFSSYYAAHDSLKIWLVLQTTQGYLGCSVVALPCWSSVKLILRNNLEWNSNWNSNISTQEIPFENVICSESAMLSQLTLNSFHA